MYVQKSVGFLYIKSNKLKNTITERPSDNNFQQNDTLKNEKGNFWSKDHSIPIERSKPQWVISLHPSEWLLFANQKIISFGESVEKLEALCTVGGNVK